MKAYVFRHTKYSIVYHYTGRKQTQEHYYMDKEKALQDMREQERKINKIKAHIDDDQKSIYVDKTDTKILYFHYLNDNGYKAKKDLIKEPIILLEVEEVNK